MTVSRREFLDDGEDRPDVAIPPRGEGHDYALVVGVNDYPELRSLRGAIADAKAFAAWLLDAGGGGLPHENVRTVVSSPNPLAPIGHEINDALEHILVRAEKHGARRFYFYFSGHGCVGDRASDLALCMANWSERRRRAALSSEAWLDVVVRSGAFDEVAFFLDCCRVWATRAVGQAPYIDYARPVERARGTRVFVAYATEFQRTAIELDESSASGAPEVRGIFTQVLIDGLRGAAKGAGGVVTASSLKDYVETETEERARYRGFHQCAEIVQGFDSRSRFGFAGRTPESRASLADNDSTGTSEDGAAFALTILHHPRLERIGDRIIVESLSSERPFALSRVEPPFAPPGASGGEPLGDAHLSRTPIHFVATTGGGVEMDCSETTTVATVRGDRIAQIAGAATFGADEIRRGVVLLLGSRVVLLLHRLKSLEAIVDGGESKLVGASQGLRRVLMDVQRVAELDVPVLVRGEEGTEKEVVARAVHDASQRREKPFVAVNLNAIAPSLAVAELFGAEKGAFRASISKQIAYFERAHGGTLLLDDIGEAPVELQLALLRTLETGELLSLGATRPKKIDVRIIAATDADLESKVASGSFRAPLLARLAAYEIWIPSLRERREDIGRLLVHFLREELTEIGEEHRLSPPSGDAKPWLPASLVARLADYDWPGNVRQLRNVVRRIVIAKRGRDRAELPLAVERSLGRGAGRVRKLSVLPREALSLGDEGKKADIAEIELLRALRASRGDLSAVSERLGIPPAVLSHSVRELELRLQIPLRSNAPHEASPFPNTAPAVDTPDARSRLVIVLYGLPGAAWSLRMGERTVAFDAETTWRSFDGSRRAFAARMHPGAYILRHGGTEAREVSLHLYPGWTTRVLIDQTALGSHFETIRVFLDPRDEAYQTTAEDDQAVELELAFLAGRASCPPALLARVMRGKAFDGPMLGLLAAHRLAREEAPDPAHIDAIADKVESMLGPCADIHALRLRAALIRGGDVPSVPWTAPPMLREGLLAFVEASHFVPEIIPPGSALEFACVERLVDSPLSSWPSRPEQPTEEDWLTVTLREIVAERGKTALTARALARELGVPTLAVTRRIEGM